MDHLLSIYLIYMGCRYRLRYRILISTRGYWSWSPKLRPDSSNELHLGQLHEIATGNTCFGRCFLIGLLIVGRIAQLVRAHL